MIETRDGSGNVLMQVIHGTRYIDEVVQLFLQDAGRVYVHQDANYNVTTLTDITGRVLERSFYSPYGQLEAVISKHPFDYDDDGDVDADDASMIDADCSGDYSGDCRRLDADGDRDIDEDDLDIIAAYIGGLSGDTALTRVPSSPRSRLGNPFAHQGLPLDAEIASYQNRARQYNPGLKRFMQRDPLAMRNRAGSGYQDGMNLSVYQSSLPIRLLDPYGACRIRWRRHKLWPFPPKYHVGIDIDCDGNGERDGTLDYGWGGADGGGKLTCCDDNKSQSKPPDEWNGPLGNPPPDYPDGDGWTDVSDCEGRCLKAPKSNYGLYCLLGIPFPFNCSNSSGALHAEVRRCHRQCGGGGQDPPWIPDWINDGDEPGWDNVPDGSEPKCKDIWG